MGILLAANYSITPNLSGGESFRVSWMGARSFLFDKANPYSVEVAKETQVAIYGHPAKEGEYPYRLDIPFYLLILYFPFAYIENFDLARALWMSFSEVALLGVGFLSVYLAEWKTSRLNLVFFFGSIFLSFYGLTPLLEGSRAVFTSLILLSSLVAFREGWDEVLGILLVFSISYFQNGGILFLFILFLLITSKRWTVLSISLMTLVALLGSSLIILPNWMIPFASSLRANIEIKQGLLLSETLQTWRNDDGLLIANLIKWTSLLILFFEWRIARSRNFQHILWVASFSIVITPFLGFRMTNSFYPFLFFPLALIFKIAQDRWHQAKWGIPLALFFILMAWGISWSIAPVSEIILAYLIPTFLLLFLYWVRWWLLRPPRTWADQVMKK